MHTYRSVPAERNGIHKLCSDATTSLGAGSNSVESTCLCRLMYHISTGQLSDARQRPCSCDRATSYSRCGCRCDVQHSCSSPRTSTAVASYLDGCAGPTAADLLWHDARGQKVEGRFKTVASEKPYGLHVYTCFCRGKTSKAHI